jgi:hypothetical protein
VGVSDQPGKRIRAVGSVEADQGGRGAGVAARHECDSLASEAWHNSNGRLQVTIFARAMRANTLREVFLNVLTRQPVEDVRSDHQRYRREHNLSQPRPKVVPVCSACIVEGTTLRSRLRVSSCAESNYFVVMPEHERRLSMQVSGTGSGAIPTQAQAVVLARRDARFACCGAVCWPRPASYPAKTFRLRPCTSAACGRRASASIKIWVMFFVGRDIHCRCRRADFGTS